MALNDEYNKELIVPPFNKEDLEKVASDVTDQKAKNIRGSRVRSFAFYNLVPAPLYIYTTDIAFQRLMRLLSTQAGIEVNDDNFLTLFNAQTTENKATIIGLLTLVAITCNYDGIPIYLITTAGGTPCIYVNGVTNGNPTINKQDMDFTNITLLIDEYN